MHRASRRVAVPSRYRWSAIGGCAEDREARTPDRDAAAAAQGNSARTRANAKTDRAGGSEGRSRAGALFGPATHGYQGPATAASAGKGEGDVGRLHRRGDGLAPTQHGQRHWNGLRDNPVSVFTALQRARISRNRPAEPNSLLVEGNIDPYQKLSGFYESDFLGVGNTSNYNQSNSWAPRLRHAYFTYDNTGWGGWGFHILAGQTWSLATQNQVDMTPRKENIPLTIDANYVVGFNYIRQWQIRGVVDVAPGIALGVSAENPAAVFLGSTATAPLGTGGAFASGGIVNGQVVNFVNTGGGGDFLQNGNVATDQAPDIIEKAAFDPGWGHYEIYGLQRFFSDNVLRCAVGACVAGSTTMVGTPDNKTTFGAGVGGSVLLPLIPKYLEFTANGLYGRGVGRYGAGQLPDVTIAADGSLSLVTGWSAMVGLICHPWEGLDVYVYAGQEEGAANFFNIGTTLFGLGNPGFSNATCLVTTPFSFSGGTPADCIANNKRLSEITAGVGRKSSTEEMCAAR